jgi:hypothetical protein
MQEGQPRVPGHAATNCVPAKDESVCSANRNARCGAGGGQPRQAPGEKRGKNRAGDIAGDTCWCRPRVCLRGDGATRHPFARHNLGGHSDLAACGITNRDQSSCGSGGSAFAATEEMGLAPSRGPTRATASSYGSTSGRCPAHYAGSACRSCSKIFARSIARCCRREHAGQSRRRLASEPPSA